MGSRRPEGGLAERFAPGQMHSHLRQVSMLTLISRLKAGQYRE